jgi:hypothetical protein
MCCLLSPSVKGNGKCRFLVESVKIIPSKKRYDANFSAFRWSGNATGYGSASKRPSGVMPVLGLPSANLS